MDLAEAGRRRQAGEDIGQVLDDGGQVTQAVDDYQESFRTVEAPPGTFYQAELSPTVPAVRPGRGPPRMADFMGTSKPFADGGGLCSPGRWAQSMRCREDRGLFGLRTS